MISSAVPLLAPRRLWEEIVDRLLAEVMVSDGVAWMQRFETINILLSHPDSQEAAIGTISSIIADRGTQSLVGTACLLDGSGHPDAARSVLRLLHDPGDDRVFKGALMACVRKIRYRHFTEAQLGTIAWYSTEVAADSTVNEETRSLAASILRTVATPPDAERTIVSPAMASLLTSRVLDGTLSQLSHDVDGYRDLELARIIHDMLFDPVFDSRLYAAFLLQASPYRDGVAAALTSEVARADLRAGSAWVTTLFEALRVVGTARQRPTIEQYVVATGISQEVNDNAAYALGHIGGHTSYEVWQRTIGHHLRLWQTTQAADHASTLDRLVYALGMAREWSLIRRLAQTPNLPAAVSTAAGWWLTQPQRIRASVTPQTIP
ncbi:hypothetical protein [Actinoplanes sp. NBRC 103695]|uniref:hypothetical protein n=1 Tax=Actinoplanes sp. NBRC 103695 TaxID=3032202 RepID=UPI00255428F9|nr:hypothetical protein [Actinoplanes sp. NBRC 103695]